MSQKPSPSCPASSRFSPRFWGYTYDAVTDSTITVMGVGPGSAVLEMVEGRLPEHSTECAVGAGVAAMWGAEVGGEVILVDAATTGILYEVVGTFAAPSDILTNDLVVMTGDEAALFLGLPDGWATDLAVRIANPSEIDTIAAKIKRAYPDSRPITRSEVLRTYDAVFHWRSGMMLAMLSGGLIAFAILAWDKATGLSAEERKEIGILKAVGWDTGDVLELKMWEGVVISHHLAAARAHRRHGPRLPARGAAADTGASRVVGALPGLAAGAPRRPVPALRHRLFDGGALCGGNRRAVVEGRDHRSRFGGAGMMTTSTNPLVIVEDVTKIYNRGAPDEVRAVRGVSTSVSSGEVLVLEGPSGSGKTSLLTVIGCMSRPTSGQVLVDGRRVSRLSEVALTVDPALDLRFHLPTPPPHPESLGRGQHHDPDGSDGTVRRSK